MERRGSTGGMERRGSTTQAAVPAHVPFRDSVLTRMLRQSIGGNCKTSLIVCVSPADSDLTETLSTLRFAARAKKVRNDARANVTIDAVDLSEQAAQIAESLQQQLAKSEDALKAARVRCERRTADTLALALKLNAKQQQAKRYSSTLKEAELASMQAVLRDRSAAAIPVGFTLFSTVNTSVWLGYGALVLGDPFIWAPNVLGLASSLTQIGLIARFGTAPPAAAAAAKVGEEQKVE